MSGIVGIYKSDGTLVQEKDISNMLEILKHRGPDGSNLWFQECVGLGHLMLMTTPESLQEKLPYVNSTEDGNYVITADARIDNRKELISLLGLETSASRSLADSQIILLAYEKWGQNCPEKLLGDFAFAIWDESKQHLFCARDHFGVKPFYYHYNSKRSFVFASEMKAILAQPSIKRQVNLTRIADFLELDFSDQVITSYKDILRLPPAHYCVVSKEGLKIQQYWSLDPHKKIHLNSDREYAEAFRELFTEAVRCRLRSSSCFSVGSHLSGGLDSSSVTCVARKVLSEEDSRPLHTFSNIFDDVPECDERIYIKEVLKLGGIKSHYIHADRTKPLSTLKQFWQYEDEAYAFPSYHYLWSLNKATQQAGVRIVLDGFDGDSVICYGYERLAELALQGEWDIFTAETKQLAKNYKYSSSKIARLYGLEQLVSLATNLHWFTLVQGINKLHSNFGFSRQEIIVKYIFNPLKQRLKHLLFSRQPKAKKYEFSLLNSDFTEQYGLSKRFDNLKEKSKLVIKSIVKRQHFKNVNNEDGVTSIAFEQADKCSAPYSVEMRHPFFDKRLVEFCLAIPSEQKFSQGLDRSIMRRALKEVLPQKIRERARKTSMSPNFINSISNLDRKELDRIMTRDIPLLKQIINIDSLTKAYKEVISNPKSNDLNNVILWRSVIISRWLHLNKLWM